MGPQPPMSLNIMPKLASAAVLRPNEMVAQVWRAGLEQDYVGMEEGESGKFNINGLLLATDQRLIFVQEKGLFDKSYKQLESIDYREIGNWKLSQVVRTRALQVDVTRGRLQRKVFNNLLEADPMSLVAQAPQNLDYVKQLLGRLKSAAP